MQKELPSTLNLSELAERCSNEILKARQNEPASDQYCLEIFRRAIVKHDPDAWAFLQQYFSDTVRRWLHRHPRREVAYRYDSEENYIAQTFASFWQATADNEKLEFTSLAAFLRYLHASLNTALIDTLRAHALVKGAPLPDPGSDTWYTEEPASEDDYESQDLWEIIGSLLPNERERRLAYLRYHSGLKPREIVQFLPDEFSDVQEVYRLTRNITERLMRNRDQIRWQLGLDDSQLPEASTFASLDVIGSKVQKELSLFALAHIALEDEKKAFVSKPYAIRAGISQNKPRNYKGMPFNLAVQSVDEPIPFDILLHASGNIELTTDWHKVLLYDPHNLEPQFVEFTFLVVLPGHSSLAVNFYHERRWLRTIRFEFDAVEQFQLTTVTSEG